MHATIAIGSGLDRPLKTWLLKDDGGAWRAEGN